MLVGGCRLGSGRVGGKGKGQYKSSRRKLGGGEMESARRTAGESARPKAE